MNILIINSVPLNGGDEALLRATIAMLEDLYSNPAIVVCGSQINICKKYIKDIKIYEDLDELLYNRAPNTSLIIKIFHKIKLLLLRKQYSLDTIPGFLFSDEEKKNHFIIQKCRFNYFIGWWLSS